MQNAQYGKNYYKIYQIIFLNAYLCCFNHSFPIFGKKKHLKISR